MDAVAGKERPGQVDGSLLDHPCGLPEVANPRYYRGCSAQSHVENRSSYSTRSTDLGAWHTENSAIVNPTVAENEKLLLQKTCPDAG